MIGCVSFRQCLRKEPWRPGLAATQHESPRVGDRVLLGVHFIVVMFTASARPVT